MFSRTVRVLQGPANPEWSPQRMRRLVLGCTAAGVLLLVAGGWAFLSRTSHGGASAATSPVRPSSSPIVRLNNEVVARDELAARPMPSLPAYAARPAPVSTRNPGPPVMLPPASRANAGAVATGYPHTPAGALAQLAALDQAALQSGSVPAARAIAGAWVLPGGPSPDQWFGTRSTAAFLSAAGLSGGGSPSLTLRATPMMGMIKGAVGSDFVVACVNFELEATLATTARVAVADCQRMLWTGPDRGGQWQIAPGPEAARPSAAWPDTDAAIDAGYVDLLPAGR